MILKVGQVTRKRTGRNVPIGSSSTVRKGRMTRWRTSKCTSSSTLAIAGGGDGADGHPHGAARHLIVQRNQRAQDQPLLPTKLPIFKIQPPKVEAVFFKWNARLKLLFKVWKNLFTKVWAGSMCDHNPACQGGGGTVLLLQVQDPKFSLKTYWEKNNQKLSWKYFFLAPEKYFLFLRYL